MKPKLEFVGGLIKLDPRHSLIDQASAITQKIHGLPWGRWKCPTCGNGGRLLPDTNLSDEGMAQRARDIHSYYFPGCTDKMLKGVQIIEPKQMSSQEILRLVGEIEKL